MLNKIHIIGGSGSGKTYIATKLSDFTGIKTYELDDIFWSNDCATFNKFNDPEIRDEKLKEILAKDSWIIEGVYFSWLSESFKDADIIFVMKPNLYLQHWRVIKRFLKRKLGITPVKKKETLKGLIDLIKWNHDYNKIKIPKIIVKLEEEYNKVEIIKNNKQIID